jgi:hypothetical protein
LIADQGFLLFVQFVGGAADHPLSPLPQRVFRSVIDRRQHHRRITHSRTQVQHPPPADALLIAKDLQQHEPVKMLE